MRESVGCAAMPSPGFLPIAALAASVAEDPPTEAPGWMLPFTVVLAGAGWWMQWRWRTGQYFMSRSTTPEREAAKLASIGYTALPAAIGATAMAVLVALFTFFDSDAGVWLLYLVAAVGVIFVGSGVWLVKELWWPTKRRTPE